MEKCSICNQELTSRGQNLMTPMDGIIVCEEHRSFANYMIPEIAKMELGLITDYPAHLKSCSICEKSLTEGEIQSFSIKTFLPVCSKHKEAESMFNKDLAKDNHSLLNTMLKIKPSGENLETKN
jgi:hypothetical protein